MKQQRIKVEMIKIKLTKIQDKDGLGTLAATVFTHPAPIPTYRLPHEIPAEELKKYVSGVMQHFANGDYYCGEKVFEGLQLKHYYLLNEEELIALCQKAFAEEIAAKAFADAVDK